MNAPSRLTIPWLRRTGLVALLCVASPSTGCKNAPARVDKPQPPSPAHKPNLEQPPKDTLTTTPCPAYSIQATERYATDLPRDGKMTIRGVSYMLDKPLAQAHAVLTDLGRAGQDSGDHAEINAEADQDGRFTLRVPTNRPVELRIYAPGSKVCGIRFRSDDRFDMDVRIVLNAQ